MATAYPGGLRKRGGLLDNEDTIQATPRNPFFGGVADLLGQAYKLPEMPRMGVPGLDFVAANRNRLMDLLGVGDVQKTAEALSYGNRLGTGRGMTYQPLPETMGAAMALAPMVAPAARMVGKGAVETGRFVAPKAGQLAEQYMVNTGGILPLDVYHGSPHIFPPTPRNPLGEFDASKIGTGEGAQAYGHGIYMAENPDVAMKYQPRDTALESSIMRRYSAAEKQQNYPAMQVYEDFGLNRRPEEVLSAIEQAGYSSKDLKSALDAYKIASKEYANQKAGSLYKADLPDEKIAQMLDWDKPLSEQPNILKVLEKNYRSDYLDMFKNRPGSDFYKAISGNEGVEDLRVSGSSELSKLGIPGIRYLDEGSRSAGKGTRNFVVFPGEEKSMTILERNAKKAEELKRLQAGGLLAP
jgi:hypothetical protein